MHLTRFASLHRISPDQSLLLNALSGAVDLIDNDLRAALLGLGLGSGPALPPAYEGALVERGYLFADREAERAALARLYRDCERLETSRPVQFVLCPTYRCNLACSYCFESPQLRERAGIMTERQVADAFSAIDRLSAESPNRPHQIVLFGGEPLLPETEYIVDSILALAGPKLLPVQVVTNGTHLRRFLKVFGRHPGVVRGAQVTLDGAEPIHNARRASASGRGSFAQVEAGIDAALREGLEIHLRVNVDSHNLPHLGQLADLLVERGWLGHARLRCQMAPVTDHHGTGNYPQLMREDELVEPVLGLWRERPELKEAFDFRLFRVLQHLISVIETGSRHRVLPRFHYCEADRGDIFTLGPDGLIYICPESIGDPAQAVGTYSPRYRSIAQRRARWERRNVLTLPECQDCNIATFCGGGCAYAARRRFGDPMHGVCAGAPEIVAAYVATLKERYSSAGSLPAASAGVSGPALC